MPSGARDHQVQQLIDNSKTLLPVATKELHASLQRAARDEEVRRQQQIKKECGKEERRLRVLRDVHI